MKRRKNGRRVKTYNDLYREVLNENVQSLTVVDRTATAILKNGTGMEVSIPPLEQFYDDLGDILQKQMEEGKIDKVDYQAPAETPWWISMLPTIIMIVIFVFFWMSFLNQSGGGGKAM